MLPNACKFSSSYVWSNWIFHSETVWRSTWISQWKLTKLKWWESGQTAIYVCFQAKGLAQIDTLSFISSSGFHRLKFPLWLKSSFRVYSRQLLYMWLCELYFPLRGHSTGLARQLSASLSAALLWFCPQQTAARVKSSLSLQPFHIPRWRINLRSQQNH